MAPHPIDIHVGRKLRNRRTLLGMSQENIGESVGVTFQQIQKYERGLNRIGASRLFEFSEILGVNVDYFFDEYRNASEANKSTDTSHQTTQFTVSETEEYGNKEILSLVRSFHAINDPLIRKRVLALIRSIAAVDRSEDDEQGRSDTEALLKVAS